jgi:hypothetical protein
VLANSASGREESNKRITLQLLIENNGELLQAITAGCME